MDPYTPESNCAMPGYAYTPDELEMMFEDALIMGDYDAVTLLFEEGAVFVEDNLPPVRGNRAIGKVAVTIRDGDNPYVANPHQLVEARDIALIVTDQGINVVRRRSDGAWRYAISLRFHHVIPHSQGVAPMQEQTQTATLQPIAVSGEKGEARWWLSCLAVIKATAADTGGQMTIIEVTEGPGSQTPLHVHHREDEAFWILEGNVTFEVGGTTIAARAGDYVFGPRDIPHRYTVGDSGCRMLFICTPGGFEDLVRDMSVPAGSRTLPPPMEGMPDFEWVARIARAHGAELLGM
jgi:quercetin dioxygenase-like cupin family protein